mgnify:CR=1 FL=1
MVYITSFYLKVKTNTCPSNSFIFWCSSSIFSAMFDSFYASNYHQASKTKKGCEPLLRSSVASVGNLSHYPI